MKSRTVFTTSIWKTSFRGDRGVSATRSRMPSFRSLVRVSTAPNVPAIIATIPMTAAAYCPGIPLTARGTIRASGYRNFRTRANLRPKNSATSFFQYASGRSNLIPERLPGKLYEHVLQVWPLHRQVHYVPPRTDYAGHDVGDYARTFLTVEDEIPSLGNNALYTTYLSYGAVRHRITQRRHDTTDTFDAGDEIFRRSLGDDLST